MSANGTMEGVLRRVVMSPAAWALAQRAGVERLAQEHLRIEPQLLGVGAAAHPGVELAAWRELVRLGAANCVGELSNAWTAAVLQHLSAGITVSIDAATRTICTSSQVSLEGNRVLAVRHIREDGHAPLADDPVVRHGVEVTFFTTSYLVEGMLGLLPPFAVLRARPAEAESIAPRAMMRRVDTTSALAKLRADGQTAVDTLEPVDSSEQADVTIAVLARAGSRTTLVAGSPARAALWSGRWFLRQGELFAARPGPRGARERAEAGEISTELTVALLAAQSWLTSAGRRRSVA